MGSMLSNSPPVFTIHCFTAVSPSTSALFQPCSISETHSEPKAVFMLHNRMLLIYVRPVDIIYYFTKCYFYIENITHVTSVHN